MSLIQCKIGRITGRKTDCDNQSYSIFGRRIKKNLFPDLHEGLTVTVTCTANIILYQITEKKQTIITHQAVQTLPFSLPSSL